jgi:hypothetical protein
MIATPSGREVPRQEQEGRAEPANIVPVAKGNSLIGGDECVVEATIGRESAGVSEQEIASSFQREQRGEVGLAPPTGGAGGVRGTAAGTGDHSWQPVQSVSR